MHDAFDHDSAGTVIEAGKGVVEADWTHPPMLAASQRTVGSPPLHGSWPASRALTVASQSMLAIAVPSLTLLPVLTNRLVRSPRCGQQPQQIKRFVPAPSGRIPLAQARRAGSRRHGRWRSQGSAVLTPSSLASRTSRSVRSPNRVTSAGSPARNRRYARSSPQNPSGCKSPSVFNLAVTPPKRDSVDLPCVEGGRWRAQRQKPHRRAPATP